MDSIYRGWASEKTMGWKMGSQREVLPTLEQKRSHSVLIEEHKQPQFTCQADTIANSSLTPSVALLVHPSGTVHSIVNHHAFKGSWN